MPAQPAAKQPAAKQPAAKQPAAKQPAAKQPAAKQPAAKQPLVKPAVMPSCTLRQRLTGKCSPMAPSATSGAALDSGDVIIRKLERNSKRLNQISIARVARPSINYIRKLNISFSIYSFESSEFAAFSKLSGLK